MEHRPERSPDRLRLIRAIGCLAYPLGAAVVGALAYMIVRIV